MEGGRPAAEVPEEAPPPPPEPARRGAGRAGAWWVMAEGTYPADSARNSEAGRGLGKAGSGLREFALARSATRHKTPCTQYKSWHACPHPLHVHINPCCYLLAQESSARSLLTHQAHAAPHWGCD